MENGKLKRIPSFEKDHCALAVGLYKSGTAHGVTTWDLRCKKPNGGDYVTPKAIHSVEHIIATLLRNGDRADDIIYFGPMGCRTGYYLLTVNMEYAEVLKTLCDCFAAAAQMTEVPGSSERECGNCAEHDLAAAKRECAEYLQILNGLTERN